MFSGSSLVHFICVQNRQVFLFYFAVREIVVKVVGIEQLLTTELRNVTSDGCPGSLSMLETCMALEKGGSERELYYNLGYYWTGQYHTYHFGPNDCIGVEFLRFNIAGLLNLIFLCLICGILSLRLVLFVCNGSWDFESGKYISFTYKLDNMLVNRALSSLSSVLIILVYAYGCYRFYTDPSLPPSYSGLDSLMIFMNRTWTAGLVLVYSGYHISRPSYLPPDFGWNKETFNMLRFKRPLHKLLLQSNAEFAVELFAVVATHGNVEEFVRERADLLVDLVRSLS